jgi:hypothetical protein
MAATTAAVVVVAPVAYAQDTSTTSFSFGQTLSNDCSGFVGCSNTGTISFSICEVSGANKLAYYDNGYTS